MEIVDYEVVETRIPESLDSGSVNDSETNKRLARTDYRIREQEVMPTAAMKEMALHSHNIISIHNHPSDSLPSYTDIASCFDVGYKYGLVVCHGGTIYQYSTMKTINSVLYISLITIYDNCNEHLKRQFTNSEISSMEFQHQHYENMNTLINQLVDAGVKLREVIWNGNS